LKKGLKQTLRAIIFLAMALLLLWLSFRDIGFRDLWATLSRADYLWLLPTAMMTLLSFFIRAHRWNLLVEPLGRKARLINVYHAVAVGYLANMIFPRLGEVTKCAALSEREKIPFDRLVGTMLVERTVDVLTVVALLGLTLIAGSTTTGSFLSENVIAPLGAKLSSSALSISLIVIMILALVIVTAVLWFALRKKLSDKPIFRKLYQFTDGIIDGLKSIARLRRRWEFILYTVLLWVVYLLMTYFPLLCLDSTAGLGLDGALFILVIGSFGMAAPVQSGLGAFHWIVSRGLLVAYSIPLQEGLAFATLSHESQLVFIALLGAISFYALFGSRRGKILSSTVIDRAI
jgi:uncharacterized protein (TIRG00374 family)